MKDSEGFKNRFLSLIQTKPGRTEIALIVAGVAYMLWLYCSLKKWDPFAMAAPSIQMGKPLNQTDAETRQSIQEEFHWALADGSMTYVMSFLGLVVIVLIAVFTPLIRRFLPPQMAEIVTILFAVFLCYLIILFPLAGLPHELHWAPDLPGFGTSLLGIFFPFLIALLPSSSTMSLRQTTFVLEGFIIISGTANVITCFLGEDLQTAFRWLGLLQLAAVLLLVFTTLLVNINKGLKSNPCCCRCEDSPPPCIAAARGNAARAAQTSAQGKAAKRSRQPVRFS